MNSGIRDAHRAGRSSRSVSAEITDGQALERWIADAQVAVELGHLLTPAMLRALSAVPERPIRLRDGDTWFLEEWERVRADQGRDKRPVDGVASSMRAWQDRHDMRQAILASLARDHIGCVALAHRFVARERRAAASPQARRADRRVAA